MRHFSRDGLDSKSHDPFIRVLSTCILWGVKVLAVIMVVVVWIALADVVVHVVRNVVSPDVVLFTIENMISTLGDILAVLVAIEIFMNIIFYVIKDSINVGLVLATALTAVSRKIIILDYKVTGGLEIMAIAAVVLAVGAAYWLVKRE